MNETTKRTNELEVALLTSMKILRVVRTNSTLIYISLIMTIEPNQKSEKAAVSTQA